jgi:choloylglycine hydrolase
MKKMFFCFFLFIACQIFACTAFQLQSQDGSYVYFRTLEYGMKLDSSILIVPCQSEFQSVSNHASALKWTTKYGYIGMNQSIAPTGISDGMNEKGLVVGCLYLQQFAEYQKIDSQKKEKAIGNGELASYLLGCCKDIEEVKEAIEKIQVVDQIIPNFDHFILPLHYYICDTSGKSIIIEYIKGKLLVYDNPLGVLTNSPPFDWQINNLSNYIHLSPDTIKELKLPKITLTMNGMGNGLIGLPGDFTPPSRFVRATFFSSWAKPQKSALETVHLGFHILNTFDVFDGIMEMPKKDIPKSVKKANILREHEITEWIIAHDRTNLLTYVRTYESLHIQKVDLKKIDFHFKGFKVIPLAKEFIIEDVSEKVEPLILKKRTF